LIYWDNVENLIGSVGIEVLVSENSLQANCFVSFAGGLKPPAVSSLLDLEQLISTLFSESELHIAPLFIPHKVGLTIDNFIVVISMANFLYHPELPKIMSVGLSANNFRFVVVLRVVGLNSEGLIAFMADDLIDVASWELHHGFRSFYEL